MKYSCIVLLVCVVTSLAGCDSDSNIDPNSSQTSPFGQTRTLEVPGTYQTIQRAINAAHNGDFIRVSAGVYTENIVIRSKGISLLGSQVGCSMLRGTMTVLNATDTSVEGFSIQGGGIHVEDSAVRITGNEVTASPGAGIWLEGCLSVVVSDNLVQQSLGVGIMVEESGGVIGCNQVLNNATEGIVVANSSPTLLGNTVSSNGRDGISIRGFINYATPLLLSNIVRENGVSNNYDIICFGNTNPTGSGNLFNTCINCAECRTFGNPATYLD